MLPSSLVSSGAGSLLLGAASLMLVAATAPVVCELALVTAGSLLPRRRSTLRPAEASLALTVIVPAHNEERLVARSVQSLRADLAGFPRSAVLVVAHNATDRTAEHAAQAGAHVLILNDDGTEGKGAALRAGFARAIAEGAEAVAVVDADSVVEPGFAASAARALASGADAFQTRYIVRGAEDTHTRLTALGFLGFNVIRPRGRSRLGLSAGIFGNGFGMHVRTLARVPYAASSLVEDLEYHLKLVDAGLRVTFLEDATVSSEMPTSTSAAASQRARWEGGRARMARVFLPRLLGKLIRGNLRVAEPALDLAGLPLASAVALLGLSVCLPVSWLRLYAVAGFAVLGIHVLCAVAAGGSVWTGMRTLLSVPGYVLWKLRQLPRTLRSARGSAAWVKTERDLSPQPADVATDELAVAGSPKGAR